MGLYAEERLWSRDRFWDIESAGLSQLSCRLLSIQCVQYMRKWEWRSPEKRYKIPWSHRYKNSKFDCLTYPVFVTMSRSNDNRAGARGGTVRSRGRGQGRYQPSGQEHHLRRRGGAGGWAFPGQQNPTMSGRQQMELMPSVSRSSGLDKYGDSCVFSDLRFQSLFIWNET